MRLRLVLVLGTAALLVLSGCAPGPAPEPTRTASSTQAASPTPTPTRDEVVDPEAAFDVTCDDVAAEMTTVVGEPTTPVRSAMSIVSGMDWLPGPAQYMFQRAGGVACSAGDEPRYWEVTMIPDAESVVAGATERQGYFGEQRRCEAGLCVFEFPQGDVLLSAKITDPALGAADVERIDDALRRLATAAAASVRGAEYVDSEIVGLECERFITPQEIAAAVGEDVVLFTDFGGWGIPAEVYTVVNGSRICFYASAEGDLGSIVSYLRITTLPAGAWAFERQEGDPATVAGAVAAKTSTGEHGAVFLDVRVGNDWIRFTTYESESGTVDSREFAEQVVRNLTIGATAPR